MNSLFAGVSKVVSGSTVGSGTSVGDLKIPTRQLTKSLGPSVKSEGATTVDAMLERVEQSSTQCTNNEIFDLLLKVSKGLNARLDKTEVTMEAVLKRLAACEEKVSVIIGEKRKNKGDL
jgi:hypothetical protein